MDAIEFVNKYPEYVNDIRKVVKPELLYILDKMDEIDPHDLVTPEGYFTHESHAFGYVWSLFLRKCDVHEYLKKINSLQ
jgi:hypothetical protein